MTVQQYDMAFLGDLAKDADWALNTTEQRVLGLAREALVSADAVVIHFGGKSGRLGEAIVGVAFLEGALQTLAAIGKERTPLTVIIDDSIAELVSMSEYCARYWPEIEVIVATPCEVEQKGAASYVSASAQNVFVLDFHAEHDGAAYLEVEQFEE